MPLDPFSYPSKINYLRVSNYRSLGDPIEIYFGNLTALVGPNGSGKSNLCDALRFLSETLKVGLEAAISRRQGIVAIRKWSSGRPNDVTFEVGFVFPRSNTLDKATRRQRPLTAHYSFQIGGSKSEDYRIKNEHARVERQDTDFIEEFTIKEGQWTSGPSELRPQITPLNLALPLIAGDERFRPLADALRNISIYSIFPDTLREPQKPDHSRPMSEHGANWSSVLKDLRKEPESRDLIAAVGQLTGDIDDFKVTQAGPYLITQFRHGESYSPGKNGKRRPRWFAAAQESDGTLRMAGILTALLQSPPPTLLGIEEPELTVHPGALPLLYDHIREASQRGQVILTTHSPDLLSLIDADEVRVVERCDGITTIAAMDESQRQAVRDRLFTPGELFRMEGLKQEVSAKTPQEI